MPWKNAAEFVRIRPCWTTSYPRIDACESWAEMRQKVPIEMGTLRKIDSRVARSKASCTESKYKHDEMRLPARVTALESVLSTLATKEDWAREVGALRSEMHQGFGNLRSEMHQEHGNVRKEMHQEFGNVRKEMHQEFGNVRNEMHEEFGNVRNEMHQEFGKMRNEIHQEFGKVRIEVAHEIVDVRRDMATEFVGVRKEIGAVRADLQGLGAQMHGEMHRLTWRLIGTIVTVGTALVAATHFLSGTR